MLELDVVDDGRGTAQPRPAPAAASPGMRERAAMLGGTLEAGPLPGGGFRVHARLPLGGAAMSITSCSPTTRRSCAAAFA